MTGRKKSSCKLGSVTETHASGRRIQIYLLVKGPAGSVTLAMQKHHASCEASLGEISSTCTAADSASVGVTQWGGEPPVACWLLL